VIKTTKQISAYRQIVAAIEHFHNKDYECAITLAGAAEGQIPERTSTHLFRVIRRRFSREETNIFINWLKHQSGSENAEITEQEVVVTMIRAIQKYVGAYEVTHPQFETFSEWCMARGHTKKPLTAQAGK
jgi:hypothetical protein